MAWIDGRTGERVVFEESDEDEPMNEPETQYTWEDAARDLALVTRLTITEASALTFPIRELLPAEEATSQLVHLLQDDRVGDTAYDRGARRGEAIAELVTLARTGDGS